MLLPKTSSLSLLQETTAQSINGTETWCNGCVMFQARVLIDRSHIMKTVCSTLAIEQNRGIKHHSLVQDTMVQLGVTGMLLMFQACAVWPCSVRKCAGIWQKWATQMAIMPSPTKNCTWLFEEVQYTQHGKNTFVVYALLLRKFILEPDAMKDHGSNSSKNRHSRRKGKVGS
jgi:hypothetical protein